MRTFVNDGKRPHFIFDPESKNYAPGNNEYLINLAKKGLNMDEDQERVIDKQDKTMQSLAVFMNLGLDLD